VVAVAAEVEVERNFGIKTLREGLSSERGGRKHAKKGTPGQISIAF
jgi:hypothetical protein